QVLDRQGALALVSGVELGPGLQPNGRGLEGRHIRHPRLFDRPQGQFGAAPQDLAYPGQSLERGDGCAKTHPLRQSESFADLGCRAGTSAHDLHRSAAAIADFLTSGPGVSVETPGWDRVSLGSITCRKHQRLRSVLRV